MLSKDGKAFVQKVESVTGFQRGKFHQMYFGCPVEHAKKKKQHFPKLMKKVQNKLHTQKSKLLSFGGKFF